MTQKKLTKILIIRFSSIGDIVWTTPVIRALKQQLAPVEIHFCTKQKYRDIIKANPYIDQCHYLGSQKKALQTLVKDLKNEKFDYVIDLHRNLRSKYLKFFLGSKNFTYKKRTWKRWLLVKFKINKLDHAHVADWYMETVAPLGIQNDHLGLDYFLMDEDKITISQLPDTHRTGFIALVIGASQYTKKLPRHKLIELCTKINQAIVLIGGPEDKVEGEAIAHHFRDLPSSEAIPIYNACGKFTINQSASLIEQAEVVFGHDTGLTHIAAAFKKKIYGIYGGTLSQYLYPYTKNHTLLENHNLSCRPCSKVGRKDCPKGHFKCMEDIKFNFDLSEYKP